MVNQVLPGCSGLVAQNDVECVVDEVAYGREAESTVRQSWCGGSYNHPLCVYNRAFIETFQVSPSAKASEMGLH